MEDQNKHKTQRFIDLVVSRVNKGTAVSEAAKVYNVPESTIYRWVRQHSPMETKIGTITLSDIENMQKKLEVAELTVKYLQESPFIAKVDKKLVMDYMEKIVRQNDPDDRPSIRSLCRMFCIDYSVFDKHLNRAKGKHTWYYDRRKRLEPMIIQIYGESGGRAGATTVWQILKHKTNEPVSRGFVKSIMKDLGLKGARQQSTKRNPFKDKTKERKRIENLLKDDFSAKFPNQKWVSDCKCVFANGRISILCVVLDLFSRRVIAYNFGRRENTRLITSTLRQAISTRNYSPNELVFHTDRGAGYISISTRRLVSKSKIVRSLSEAHEPPENGVAEAFFSRFAHEELSVAYNNMHYRSEREMKERIANYIHKFNHERPHEYNDGLTPVQKETNYRREHIGKRIFREGIRPID